jgi:opacity protein-like surface antigen
MYRRVLLLTSLFLVLAAVAQAQAYRPTFPSRDNRWEFSIQTRYTAGQTHDGDGGSSVKLQEDLGWGFGFGYNLSQHFYLGGVVAWRSIPYEATIIDGDDSRTSDTYSSRLDISTLAFEGSAYLLKGKITPYLSGGFGWTTIDSNIYAGSIPGCWWDPWWGYVCGNIPATYGKNTTSYTVGVGGRLELTDSFHLRAGYEYGRVNAGSVGGTSMIRLDIGWRFD